MDDFNVLEITTVQPDARPAMRGSQGQKPRNKTKAQRERPRREESARKKAEHEQHLKDMVQQQQSGSKAKDLQAGSKGQLQVVEIKQEDEDDADDEMQPAQTSTSVAAKEVGNLDHPVAGPLISSKISRLPAAKEVQGVHNAVAETPVSAKTSKCAVPEAPQGQYYPAGRKVKAALASKPPTAKKNAQGSGRAGAGTLNKSFKFPAANEIHNRATPPDLQQVSRSPSAALSHVVAPASNAVLNEEALQRLGSEHPCAIGAWAKKTAMETGTTSSIPPDEVVNPDEVVDSIEYDPDNDSTLIDCTTAPREYVRILGNLFPIWKPSDRDGADTGTGDIFGAQLPHLDHRWKVFQTDIGPYDWKAGNHPPKFVRLDDLAVHQVLTSNIPKGKLSQFWPHDFAGVPGKVRRQRVRIGRHAIKDATAEGNEKFHHTILGGQGVRPYYFSGTANYQAIRYRLLPKVAPPSHAEISDAAREKRRIDAILDAEETANPNRRAHGHNQYTPDDIKVKYGAPSGAKPKHKDHNLPSLPRSARPFSGLYSGIHTEPRLVGGMAESAHESVVAEKKKAHQKALSSATREELEEELQSRPGIQDDDEDDEDDLDELIKRPKPKIKVPAKRSVLDAMPTADDDLDDEDRPVTRRAFQVPRVLGMVDRHDLEMRIAAHVMEGKPSKEALAEEFAREHVKAEQRAKEIALLKAQLPEAEDED